MKANILIVDDNNDIRDLLKKYLEKKGYQCFPAENAVEAMSCFNRERIDLALLDINMPGKSGVELLQEAKSSFPEAAFIMATAADDYSIASHCLDIGADDYIVKPFQMLRVLVSVRNTLEKKSLFLAYKTHQAELENNLVEQEKKIKTSQATIVQQEKLATIGQLAAGVAHEINNPLGFITSNLSSLQKYGVKFNGFFTSLEEVLCSLSQEQLQQIKGLKKQFKIEVLLEDLPDLISEAQEGTTRIHKIVQGLKRFSRAEDDTPAPVDINDCLESAITIVWNEIKYKSELERDFGDLPPILGYSQQLAQVFMNLLINASHAIQEKGLTQIKTRHERNNIVVTVTDNGCGISEANLTKIFDPFFTTKEAGKGTGLGMSIAAEIVEKHGGTIAVQSVVGEGTKFTVSLPVKENLP